MALLLSSEQELVQRVVREFALGQLAPEATRIDRESLFARDHLAKFAPLGLLGMTLSAEHGGSGTDALTFLVSVEEVARASGTDAALLVLENAVVAPLLSRLGSDAQRAKFLAPVVAGRQWGAVAFTEEAGGTNLGEPLTIARRQGDGWLLSGSKAFVAGGGVADWYLVLADIPGEGVSFLLVPSGATGLHVTPPESKLGLRGLPLTELYLNRVPLPADALLGKPGLAAQELESCLDTARLGVAAALVGLTQASLDAAFDFAKGRVQFGQPIAQFGAVRGMLADAQAELDAARATMYGAAQFRDGGRPYRRQALEARLLAHKVAVKGSRISQKVHGGAGFMRDLPVERYSRDIRTLMHLWDAHDIARSRLANELLGPATGV